MSEALSLACYGIAFLLLFTAIGSGVVSYAARTHFELLLAPLVGLALSASVLTTAAAFTSMRIAAFAVLLPGAIVSIVIATTRPRLWRSVSWRGAALAVGAAVAAFSLAALPGFVRDTAGPSGLAIYDSLIYVQLEEALQHAKIGTEPDPSDLVSRYGTPGWNSHYRLGISAVNSASATLVAAGPDKTNFAELAAVFALLPLGIYVVARGIGAHPPAAWLAGALVLSPSMLLLVADSATPNLAALVFIPPLLLTGARWFVHQDRCGLVVGACLLAGLLSSYPEFVSSVVLIGALGLGLLVWQARGMFFRVVRTATVRTVALAGLVVLMAPVGTKRAVDLLTRYGDFVGGQPPRFLTFESSWAWLYGTLHLYELQRFSLLSDLKLSFAVGLPVLLTLVLIYGLLSSGLRRAIFVAAPIVVAIAVGLWTLERYQGGDCEYCLWKSLTLVVPFASVGVALGAQAIASLSGSLRIPARGAVAAVIVLAIAGLARANMELTEAVVYSPASITAADRGLTELVRSAGGEPILIEGADSTVTPAWTVP